MATERICAVIGCGSINYYLYKDSETPQRKFLKFPKDLDMCVKWIEKLNRLDLVPILREKGPEEISKSFRVCSDHFAETDFIAERFRRKRPLLLPGAIPNRNLGDENLIYLQGAPEEECLKFKEETHSYRQDGFDGIKEEVVKSEIEEISPKQEPMDNNSEHKENVNTCYEMDNVQIKSEVDSDEINEEFIESQEDDRIKQLMKKDKEKMKLLQKKLNEANDILRKYRIESAIFQKKNNEIDQLKNKYIDFHLKGRCKGKETCTSCQKDFALDLYMKSPTVYKSLQTKFCLPHTVTLYRWKLKKQDHKRLDFRTTSREKSI